MKPIKKKYETPAKKTASQRWHILRRYFCFANLHSYANASILWISNWGKDFLVFYWSQGDLSEHKKCPKGPHTTIHLMDQILIS